MSVPISAIIIGGGIGGLTAAAALGGIGARVTLVERAPEFGAVGAGIQLSPNGSRIVRALGLGPFMDLHAVRPAQSRIVEGATGEELDSRSINTLPYHYGSPHELMYRPDLIEGLRRLASDAHIVFGQTVTHVDQDEHTAIVHTDTGDAYRADVVIGADGIHSRVRAQLWGDQTPVFTGKAAYRAVVDADFVSGLLDPTASVKYWGPRHGHHFVAYPIQGGKLFNITAVTPEDSWWEESWSTLGDLDEFRNCYQHFASPIPEVTQAIPEVYKWALHDRPPLERWSKGKITLLGDACHPMVPFLGQGAVMAIEDAAVLAREIAAVEDSAGIPSALRRYESERIPRTAHVQRASAEDSRQSWADRDWLFGYEVDGLIPPAAAKQFVQESA